jgi:hypothetical protein
MFTYFLLVVLALLYLSYRHQQLDKNVPAGAFTQCGANRSRLWHNHKLCSRYSVNHFYYAGTRLIICIILVSFYFVLQLKFHVIGILWFVRVGKPGMIFYFFNGKP